MTPVSGFSSSPVTMANGMPLPYGSHWSCVMPALQRLRNLDFHDTTNPQILAFSKTSDDGTDVVLTVVNLDPWNTQECTLVLDLAALGLPFDRPYEAYDELSNQSFTWQGPEPYVRLDPYHDVAHVLHLRPLS